MKLRIMIIAALLISSSTMLTQTVRLTADSSKVTLAVYNAIDHSYLSEYIIKFSSNHDTSIFFINSAGNQYFTLDTNEKYNICISKKEFDDAIFDFDYSTDLKLVLIEVFLPPLNITYGERGTAHRRANKLAIYPLCDWCDGGLKKARPGCRRFWLYRIHCMYSDGSVSKGYQTY